MTVLKKITDYIINNDIENAYQLIVEVEEDYIKNAEYWNLRGVLCLKINEYTTAIGCLRNALEIEPNNSDSYYNYAFALENIGDFSEAALYYGLSYKFADNTDLKSELASLYSGNITLKNIFNEAAYGTRKSITILSSCGWGDVYQRMHHIARSLVKYGHDVNYITPSIQVEINDESVADSALTKFSFDNMKIIDGVKIYTPLSASNNQKSVANNYIDLVQELLESTSLEEKVIITYLPYQINILNSLKGQYFHIYECVDDHSDLDYAFWGSKKDVIWEQELMDKADAITTTATSLFLQRVSIEERENVFLSRNAVNENDFIINGNNDIPEDLINIPEPRIVFTGVIYERFDEKLFYDVVDSNPNKSFVIIGPIHNGMLEQSRSNLYILGAKKHSALKNYLKHMQIGIVPYIDNADMDIACDSIKQYEYIACGLPVITTFMPESGMDKIYTFLANTTESFNEAIERCLNLKIDSNVVRNFLVENSWHARAALLCRIANQSIGREEKMMSLKGLGQALKNMANIYDYSIFKTLYGVYSGIENNNKFEGIAEQIYNTSKEKYVEKQYLNALLKNKNTSRFMEVVFNSSFIKKELKEELAYCNEYEIECVEAISCMCMEDIKGALNKINGLSNKSLKSLYPLYIKYILGEMITHQELISISKTNKKSPLFNFFYRKDFTKV